METQVIVPTTGRLSLARALSSVRAQQRPASIIVVLDKPEMIDAVEPLMERGDSLILTSGGLGGAASRNIGLAHATATYVAYLDDDDFWQPDKLEQQLTYMNEYDYKCSFTSSIFVQSNGAMRALPLQALKPETSIGDYLVNRPHLRHGSGFIQSSSLVILRGALQHVRWDESLKKHQDWDYVLRLVEQGIKIAQIDLPLTWVAQGSGSSISLTRSWSASLQWYLKHQNELGVSARGDFIATQILRAALAQGSARGVYAALQHLRGTRPHAASLLVGIAGIAGGLRRIRNKRHD